MEYPEFLRVVLPQFNRELRKLATNRTEYFVGRLDTLPLDVEFALARVFSRELQLYRSCEQIRLLINGHRTFSLVQSFRALDRDNYGWVDDSSVRFFL